MQPKIQQKHINKKRSPQLRGNKKKSLKRERKPTYFDIFKEKLNLRIKFLQGKTIQQKNRDGKRKRERDCKSVANKSKC